MERVKYCMINTLESSYRRGGVRIIMTRRFILAGVLVPGRATHARRIKVLGASRSVVPGSSSCGLSMGVRTHSEKVYRYEMRVEANPNTGLLCS
jgi:hypothetical protein